MESSSASNTSSPPPSESDSESLQLLPAEGQAYLQTLINQFMAATIENNAESNAFTGTNNESLQSLDFSPQDGDLQSGGLNPEQDEMDVDTEDVDMSTTDPTAQEAQNAQDNNSGFHQPGVGVDVDREMMTNVNAQDLYETSATHGVKRPLEEDDLSSKSPQAEKRARIKRRKDPARWRRVVLRQHYLGRVTWKIVWGSLGIDGNPPMKQPTGGEAKDKQKDCLEEGQQQAAGRSQGSQEQNDNLRKGTWLRRDKLNQQRQERNRHPRAMEASQLGQVPAADQPPAGSGSGQSGKDYTEAEREMIMDRLIKEKVGLMDERARLRAENQQLRVRLNQTDSQSDKVAHQAQQSQLAQELPSTIDKDAQHKAEIQEIKDASQQHIRELQAAISSARADGMAEGRADQQKEIEEKNLELNRLHSLLAERDLREDRLSQEIEELKRGKKADKRALADLLSDNELLTNQYKEAETAAKSSREAEKQQRSERERADKEAKEAGKTSQEAEAQAQDARTSLAKVKRQNEQALAQALERETALHATIHRQDEQLASMVALEDFQETEHQLQLSQADVLRKEAELSELLASKERSDKTLLEDLTGQGLEEQHSSEQLSNLGSELVQEEDESKMSGAPLYKERGTQTTAVEAVPDSIQANGILKSVLDLPSLLPRSLLVGLTVLGLFLMGVIFINYYPLSATREPWIAADDSTRWEVVRSAEAGDFPLGESLGPLNTFGTSPLVFEMIADWVIPLDAWSKFVFVVSSFVGAGESPLLG